MERINLELPSHALTLIFQHHIWKPLGNLLYPTVKSCTPQSPQNVPCMIGRGAVLRQDRPLYLRQPHPPGTHNHELQYIYRIEPPLCHNHGFLQPLRFVSCYGRRCSNNSFLPSWPNSEMISTTSFHHPQPGYIFARMSTGA